MAKSVIYLTHDQGAADMADLIQGPSASKLSAVQKLIAYFRALSAGIKGAVATVAVNSVQATGTFTLSSAVATNTIVVNGVTFTAVSMRKDFGDDDLAKLGPVMPALVSLDLSASTVTDKGAALLKGASDLKSLRLSETGVTDAGLDAVATLPQLESLNLYGTQVTNEGVLKLAGLKNLKKLYLWQTKVDDAGLQALKSKLPGCEIVMGL